MSDDSLDGVTFRVIVRRLKPREKGGDWLVRVYAADEHVHGAEGGVPYDIGLREAHKAMEKWVRENGGGSR